VAQVGSQAWHALAVLFLKAVDGHDVPQLLPLRYWPLTQDVHTVELVQVAQVVVQLVQVGMLLVVLYWLAAQAPQVPVPPTEFKELPATHDRHPLAAIVEHVAHVAEQFWQVLLLVEVTLAVPAGHVVKHVLAGVR